MIFKAYPKIPQFRNVIRDVSHKSNYKGLDAEGKPMYEVSDKPTLLFRGTVKLHGTNAGICYTPEEGIVAQKRNSLIRKDTLADHYDFNRFVQVDNNEKIVSLMEHLHSEYCKEGEQITLYGEWAGKKIQKGVAISMLDRQFYAFDCRVFNKYTEVSEWIDLRYEDLGIYGIRSVFDIDPEYMEIEFNNPGLVQNDLIEITNKVEALCPISAALGEDGVGEGMVWSAYWKGERFAFKVKGDKHSATKVKKLAEVDVEVLKSINEFVDYACTPNRIDQGIEVTGAKEKKDIPLILKWVANDIIDEETDTLEKNGLEWKQVAREVSNRIRQYFFMQLDFVDIG